MKNKLKKKPETLVSEDGEEFFTLWMECPCGWDGTLDDANHENHGPAVTEHFCPKCKASLGTSTVLSMSDETDSGSVH